MNLNLILLVGCSLGHKHTVAMLYFVFVGLTYKDREEENRHRDVEDRAGDVKEPVRSHREET